MATVASSSVTAETSATSITITKPSGLAEDDVLVAVIVEEDGGTPSTPSGWTLIHSQSTVSSMSDRVVAFFGKVADSSDVAASNFSFSTSSGTHVLSGVLLRVTDAAADTNTWVGDGGIAFNNNSSPSISISVTPANTNSALIAFIGAGSMDTATDISSPSISGTNPSWTELNQQVDGNIIYATYYADQPSASEITGINASFATRNSVTDDGRALVSIGNREDESGSNTLASTTSSAFAASGIADGVANQDALVTTTSSAFSQNGSGNAPTQWTNESQASTTWTNQDKL